LTLARSFSRKEEEKVSLHKNLTLLGIAREKVAEGNNIKKKSWFQTK
jgi:hypothetical protein